jgi:hypothetical protein
MGKRGPKPGATYQRRILPVGLESPLFLQSREELVACQQAIDAAWKFIYHCDVLTALLTKREVLAIAPARASAVALEAVLCDGVARRFDSDRQETLNEEAARQARAQKYAREYSQRKRDAAKAAKAAREGASDATL